MTFAFLVLYIVASYIYPGEVVPSLAQYHITYWIGTAGLLVAAMSLAWRRALLRTRELWLLLAFTLTLGVSRMVADRWPGAPLAVFRQFGPSLTMFVLAVCGVTSLRKLRVAAMCVVALSVGVVVQGAAAFHLGYRAGTFLFDPATRGTTAAVSVFEPEPLTPSEPLWEGEELEPDDGGDSSVKRIRGLGLLHDPNDLALALVMALPLVLGVWSPRIRHRVYLTIAGLPLCYGVFLTHSRGGALALIVTLWRASAIRFGRFAALLLLFAMLGGVVALDFSGGRTISGPDESIAGRFDAWSEGLQMLKSNPVLGIGFAQFLDYHIKTAHNSFVLCFAEAGMLGYFFWLGLLVSAFMSLGELKRLRGQEDVDKAIRLWANALQLSLIGFVTAGFFLSRTFVPILYLILGLSVALTLLARGADKPAWSPSLARFTSLVLASEFATVLLVYVLVNLRIG